MTESIALKTCPYTGTVAAVDVGTNSLRCLVAENRDSRHYRLREDLRFPVRLGEGLKKTGMISPAARDRLDHAVSWLSDLLRTHNVSRIRAVGTSALRTASNAAEVLRDLRDRYGLDIRPIPPEEEAALAFRSARNLAPETTPMAMLDIGGGSSEFALENDQGKVRTVSLDTGSVYITEQYLLADPPTPEEVAVVQGSAMEMAQRLLAPLKLCRPLPLVVGIGGTVATLALWVSGRRRGGELHGMRIRNYDVFRGFSRLAGLSVTERIRDGIPPDRADVIVGGLALLAAFVRYLGTEHILVNDRGLREGIVLSLLASFQEVPGPDSP